MINSPQLLSLDSDGACVVRGLIDRAGVERLRGECDALLHDTPRAGVRFVAQRSPAMADVVRGPEIGRVIAGAFSGQAFLVRLILFDKTPDANWDVVWHQDLSIPVRCRRESPGFGPWSTKDDRLHVQPPVSVLERMLTVRLHLDDAPLSNGPLLVVRGSHRRGIIDLRSLDAAECERNASPLLAAAGDAVLMRPLMLHASKKSLAAVHRRVLHLEFAADPLPDGLEWDVELELCAPVQSS